MEVREYKFYRHKSTMIASVNNIIQLATIIVKKESTKESEQEGLKRESVVPDLGQRVLAAVPYVKNTKTVVINITYRLILNEGLACGFWEPNMLWARLYRIGLGNHFR